MQILLSIVTLGIYGVYWAYVSHDEIKSHADDGVGGVIGAVIYVFVGIITLFLLPIEIQRMYERDGVGEPGQRKDRLLGPAVRHSLVRQVPGRAERLLGGQGGTCAGVTGLSARCSASRRTSLPWDC
ncbi:MAG: DUF4234 domain-containing protein [Actinomycetota bacterium]|nr:DUF4234 domain-containing protein [Actinomycetota bacterium]